MAEPIPHRTVPGPVTKISTSKFQSNSLQWAKPSTKLNIGRHTGYKTRTINITTHYSQEMHTFLSQWNASHNLFLSDTF